MKRMVEEDEFTIPKPDCNLLHWFACFASCCCYILISVFSDVSITRLTKTFENEDWVPYSVSNPLAFWLCVHTLIGIFFLIIYLVIGQLWRLCGLPSSTMCKRRLRTSRSVMGNAMAHIAEQFDDSMIDGILGHPKLFWGIFICGPLMLLIVASRYLWTLSIINIAPPFAQVINYAFIICIPTFSLWILRDSLHSMKLVAVVACFIGIYFHFLGDVSLQTLTVDFSGKVRGSFQGVISAVLLGLYLVLFKLFNPSGWMTVVLACQGIGAGLLGSLSLPFLGFIGEKFHLPTHRNDLKLIFVSSLWSCPLWYCINEAIRWGDPSTIATAFVVAPTALVFIQAFLSWDSTEITRTHIIALALSSFGFSVDIVYQLFVALRRRKTLYLAERKNLQDMESEEKLIIEGEYTI